MLDLRLLLAVALPLAAAAGIALSRPRAAEVWTFAAAVAAFLLSASLVPDVLAGAAPAARAVDLLPGVPLAFSADGLGLTFGLLASGLWIATSLYSSGYVRAAKVKNTRRYFACFAASVGAALGIAYSANLLTFLVFYEVLTIATYPLVSHDESPKAIAAGRRYLAYAISAGLALTIATAWTWSLAGTLDLRPGGIIPASAPEGVRLGLLALFLLGCGVKAGIMPLHAWLPGAMVAPTPVSALLHAVAVVKAGVFGCLRVVGFVLGPGALEGTIAGPALTATCLATIACASIIAIRQDNLKRRLAYSTIAHLSYMVLGAALLDPTALAGGVMHLVNHGLAKITLFFCAGAIYAVAHVETVSGLSGLARKMPWTFGAFTVAAFGMMGLPGLCGFTGKLLLARGAVETGSYLTLALLLTGSVLSAVYLLPILRIGFLGALPADAPRRDAPLAMLVPLAATAALVVVLGAAPFAIDLQHRLAASVAAAVFGAAG